jgi:hypothetical protein
MYRLLEVGETVQENDECYMQNDGGWKKVQSSGTILSDGVLNFMPIRREIISDTDGIVLKMWPNENGRWNLRLLSKGYSTSEVTHALQCAMTLHMQRCIGG